MNREVEAYINNYPKAITELFGVLRQLIYDSIKVDPIEKLWAKMPSYYVGEAFVRLIPFKDHINIEARAITERKEIIPGYSITPKGMLMIHLGDVIPTDALRRIFTETLTK